MKLTNELQEILERINYMKNHYKIGKDKHIDDEDVCIYYYNAGWEGALEWVLELIKEELE